MVTIVCPKCGAEGKLSLVDSNYNGPRRCWKCHELFTINIVNNQVRSSESLSQEEYQKQLEAKAAKDGNTNFKFSKPGQDDDIPKLTPERRRNYNQPFNQSSNQPSKPPSAQPPSQAEPEQSKAPASPPDKFRTFIPLETQSPEEPKKAAPKSPATDSPAPKKLSDWPRPFIPPAT
jgi:hypothetical protein